MKKPRCSWLTAAVLLCSWQPACEAQEGSAGGGGFSARALPEPSGPLAVGTLEFSLVRSVDGPIERSDRPGRILMAQLWYPASVASEWTPAPYLTHGLLAAMVESSYLNLEERVVTSWRAVRTSAQPSAPVLDALLPLPLLVMSHGLQMSRASYTSYAQDLASHGYAVVAIDHPFSGLTVGPDGEVLELAPHPEGPDGKIQALREDASFVVDALIAADGELSGWAGVFDSDAVGMFGHSLGGAAALEACGADPRVRACADLDGDPFESRITSEGSSRPFLVVLHVPEESHRPPLGIRRQRDEQWLTILTKSSAPGTIIKVDGTNHFSFTDLPFLVPKEVMLRNGATIAPDRVFEITTRTLRAFFGRYLGSTGDLESLVDEYPEVEQLTTLSPPGAVDSERSDGDG